MSKFPVRLLSLPRPFLVTQRSSGEERCVRRLQTATKETRESVDLSCLGIRHPKGDVVICRPLSKIYHHCNVVSQDHGLD